MRVRLPGGEELGTGGPLMVVHDAEAFHRRIGAAGLIGFGESYLAREWDAGSGEDLVGVLTVLAGHTGTLVPAGLRRLRGMFTPRMPRRRGGFGRRHDLPYELPYELFALFLDPTLSYSSALFDQVPARWGTFPLAQHRKVDRLLDLAGVGPGTRLLEIGTGWGGLALRAAGRGAEVLTVTHSEEQGRLAAHRFGQAGLQGRVAVAVRDYREVRGSYDAVVSVETVEAVGAGRWPDFFGGLDRLLAPGGRIALQTITMPHERMLASRRTYSWMHKYVFPGGLLPSVEAIEQVTSAHTRLRVAEREGFGAHYAETLRLWRERFTERAEEAAALGFDSTFRRMWTFYLAYAEAGFRSRYLDVQQMLLLADR